MKRGSDNPKYRRNTLNTLFRPRTTSLCHDVCDTLMSRFSALALSFQPGPGGKRKDRPELFFPRGFTPLSDGLESPLCPTHPLGIGVWDVSRLIDPQNPPTSPGGWVPDGHPLGMCPFLVRLVSQPWVGRRGRVQSPSDFDGKVRNLGQVTFCQRPQIRFPPT